MDRKVEISKEEIPGSKRSMCGYILPYSRLLFKCREMHVDREGGKKGVRGP